MGNVVDVFTYLDSPAAAGNNRKVHLIRRRWNTLGVSDSMCGVSIPNRPQTTQTNLPHCKHCFGK